MESNNEYIELVAKYNTLLQDNIKLKQLSKNLKTQIDKKNQAIANFKEWQKKATERNAQYWFDKYLNEMGDSKEIKKYKEIRSLILKEDNFNKEFQDILSSYRSHIVTHKEYLIPQIVDNLAVLQKDVEFLEKIAKMKSKIKEIDKLRKKNY